MAIQTRSQFYYIDAISADNYAVDFDEGATQLQASLNFGSYSHSELIVELERALNEAGGQEYTVTMDRTTRQTTISATLNFSILCQTGARLGITAWTLLGFTGADKTGSNSYTGSSVGGVYRPQFWLQKYIPSSNIQRKTSASVSKASSGFVQVVSFGSEFFMECEINYITDTAQSSGSPIESNATGYQDAIDFLVAITNKVTIEFMADRSIPASFEKFILERTEDSQDGTGFKLVELLDRNVPDYYRTGKLQFRKVV